MRCPELSNCVKAWSYIIFKAVSHKSFFLSGNRVIHLRPDQETDRRHFIDPATGSDLEILDTQLLLDWLALNYRSFGTTLEIVTDKSQEGAQFVRGFGGIGGKSLLNSTVTHPINVSVNYV